MHEEDLMPTRPSYLTIARQRYRGALWIHGRGPYASLAYCGGLTVMLYETLDEALAGKRFIDRLGCGHACHGDTRPGSHVVERLTEEPP
jgi:hypothetical protein